jgi:hypothetical protein
MGWRLIPADAKDRTERSWSQVEEDITATTGEPRVHDALRKLGELDDLPVSEHPAVFERVHGQLVDVLGELRWSAADDRKAAG